MMTPNQALPCGVRSSLWTSGCFYLTVTCISSRRWTLWLMPPRAMWSRKWTTWMECTASLQPAKISCLSDHNHASIWDHQGGWPNRWSVFCIRHMICGSTVVYTDMYGNNVMQWTSWKTPIILRNICACLTFVNGFTEQTLTNMQPHIVNILQHGSQGLTETLSQTGTSETASSPQ